MVLLVILIQHLVDLILIELSYRSDKQTRKTAGTAENPATNKLHNVTFRLSNTTRKYIFTHYRILVFYHQYLNDLDFDLSMSLKVKSIGAIILPIYDIRFPINVFNCNIVSN